MVGSIVGCSCASHAAPTLTPAAIPSPTVEITPTTEITIPTSNLADKVAYVCGCKPDEHNPGGGGNNTLYVDITHMVTYWQVNPEKNYGLIGYAVDIQDDTCIAEFNSDRQRPDDLRTKLTLVYGS